MSKDHYVPQFYLKQWAGSDGLIASCRYIDHIKEFRWSQKSAAAFCYQDELYGISEEDYFKPLDTDADQFIKKLHQLNFTKPVEIPLTDTQGIKWAHFLLSMIYRAPENIEKIAEAFKIHGLEKDDAVSQIPAMIDNGRAIDDLRSMRWMFAKLPSRYELITSDNPLICSFSMPLDDNSKMILPLGPYHCFIACRNDAGRQLPMNATALAKYINTEMINKCDDRIFAKSKHSVAPRLIERNWEY